MKPAVGAVFVNPRGRSYEVIGHCLVEHHVIVRDVQTQLCDLAIWSLMTAENGWTLATPPPCTHALVTILAMEDERGFCTLCGQIAPVPDARQSG